MSSQGKNTRKTDKKIMGTDQSGVVIRDRHI